MTTHGGDWRGLDGLDREIAELTALCGPNHPPLRAAIRGLDVLLTHTGELLRADPRALDEGAPVVRALCRLTDAERRHERVRAELAQQLECSRDIGELPATWDTLTTDEQIATFEAFWMTMGPRHPLCHALTRLTRTAAVVEEARFRFDGERALCTGARPA